MRHRRLIAPAAAVALALLAAIPAQAPASAQVAGTKTLQVPYTAWSNPSTDSTANDGIGTWVYVAPQAPPTAGQLSAGRYQYVLRFAFEQLRTGVLSLTTGPNGNVAGLSLTDPLGGSAGAVQTTDDWSPGRFYFLYAHLLPGGTLGAWVMDWAAGTWAYIGSVPVPADSGHLVPTSQTGVQWDQAAARPATCADYPRTDAYWYSPLGYTGSRFTIESNYVEWFTFGDCPSKTDVLSNGWIHYRTGADPTG